MAQSWGELVIVAFVVGVVFLLLDFGPVVNGGLNFIASMYFLYHFIDSVYHALHTDKKKQQADHLPHLVREKQLQFTQEISKLEKKTLWRHYKGDEYIIIHFVMNEEDESMWVVYRKVKEDTNEYAWIRSWKEWNAIVVNKEGVSVPRFMAIE